MGELQLVRVEELALQVGATHNVLGAIDGVAKGGVTDGFKMNANLVGTPGFHLHYEVYVETGRTHQIRVHLKAIGHPALGDPIYGSENVMRGSHLQRQFLHSYQLQFTHPFSGEALQFEAPLPADLQQVLELKNSL